MDNGMAAIIASGIASLVSLIIFIGSNLFTHMNANKPYKIKIYERQLFKVFTPLEILLEKNGSDVTPKLLEDIREIIYANFTLIPDTLFHEYKKLTVPLSDKSHTTFVLHDIVSTYYNSRKKELGYPFNRNAINLFCLDGDESLAAFIKSLKNPTLITLFIFAGATALFVIFAFVDEEWVFVIKSIFAAYIIGTLYLWFMGAPMFKLMGSHYKKAYKKSAKEAIKKQNERQTIPPTAIKSATQQSRNNTNKK